MIPLLEKTLLKKKVSLNCNTNLLFNREGYNKSYTLLLYIRTYIYTHTYIHTYVHTYIRT